MSAPVVLKIERLKPGDITMADAMPFQQHFEARTALPLERVINDQWLLNQRDQIYAGDVISVCRMDVLTSDRRGARLLEVATVRVVEITANAVRLHLIGEIEVLPEAEGAMKDAPSSDVEQHSDGTWTIKWNGPTHKWCVLNGNSEILIKSLDKPTAEAIANGHVPLPAAA